MRMGVAKMPNPVDALGSQPSGKLLEPVKVL
jgi:hypothetical protein